MSTVTKQSSKNGNGFPPGTGFVTSFTDPAVVIEYGSSGLGKTSGALYSFPYGFFLANKGQLKPAIGLVGFTPAHDDRIKTLEELIQVIPQIASQGFDAIVIDDLSVLAQRTADTLRARFSRSGNQYVAYQILGSQLLRLRDLSRDLGVHVIMNCHELPPRMEDGQLIRGGPALPGKIAPRDFPPVADMVLRIVPEPAKQHGWKAVYRCSIDEAAWFTKDRHNATPDRAPANLSEVLRNAGYTIRRAPGLEWIEDVVEWTVQAASAVDPSIQKVMSILSQQIFPTALSTKLKGWNSDAQLKVLRWLERDALDRMSLRLARRAELTQYGIVASQVAGSGARAQMSAAT